MHFPPRSLAAVLLLLGACVDRSATGDEIGTPETETGSGEAPTTETGSDQTTTDTGPGETETGTTDETTTDTGPGADLPMNFCEEACGVFAEDGCLTEQSCLDVCDAESDGWTAAVADAFTICIETNPLCFVTLEGCMLAELHPPGSNLGVQIEGADLDAYEGKTVRAWGDPQLEPQFGDEAVITNGGFAFAWTAPVMIWDSFGPLVMVYIDVDGDGQCDGDIDITASIQTEWNGDLLEPVFEGLVVPPINPAAFVCGFQP